MYVDGYGHVLEMNRELAALPEFGNAQIDSRQRLMAEKALALFPMTLPDVEA